MFVDNKPKKETSPEFGIYIHWPFCLSKCPYCDFNSYILNNIDYDIWCDAYIRRIKYWVSQIKDKQKLTSIYFGGGTPSLMPADIVDKIINEIAKYWQFADNVEITIEANPTSVEINKFKLFKDIGINRVSLGVQSLIDSDLKKLGRQHSVSEAITAIELACQYFKDFSFDLIYARAGQNLSGWEKELKKAFKLAGKHISLYQLTIEKGTLFYTLYNRGELSIPDSQKSFEFYNLTNDIANSFNYSNYEISNYAKEGGKSRHNLLYWNYCNYVGIGAGAHSRVEINNNKFAIQEHTVPQIWVNDIDKNFKNSLRKKQLTPEERLEELLIMGLRLLEPITYDKLKAENNNYQEMLDFIAIDNLKKNNLLQNIDNAIAVTKTGRLLLNQILANIFKN